MDRSRLKPEDIASDLAESLDRSGMDRVDNLTDSEMSLLANVSLQ